MKNLSVVCFIILAVSYNAFAKWGFVPLDELVRDSDLIVIGTLQSISEYSKEDTDYGEGMISIEKVLSGNVKTINGFPLKAGDGVQLKWHNLSMIACPRVEHKWSENKKEIWLLTVENDKTVRADYPGRSMSLDNLAEVKKNLQKQNSSNKTAKIVKTQNDAGQISQPLLAEQTSETVYCALYSEESKQKEYSPFQALLVILASISLYYLSYRSRFKIR